MRQGTTLLDPFVSGGRGLLGTLLIGMLLSLALPAEGRAGSFPVTSCSSQARSDDTLAYRGQQSSRRMVIKRACNIFTRGRTGLITANQKRRGKVRRGEHATLVLRAPPGTALTSIRWSGQASRGDCGFGVEMYGVGPHQPARYLARLPATRRCRLTNASSAGRPRPRTFSLGRSTQVVQRVTCRDRGGCSTSKLTALRTYLSQVRVVDVSRPAVRITGGGLASRRWVRGFQQLRFGAQDNVGIARQEIFAGGIFRASQARPCDRARTVPCPNGAGLLGFNTSALPDGPRPMRLDVRDGAGNPSSVGFTSFVDNTAPGRASLSLDGGQGWRRTNAFTARWANARERHARIAGVRYRICRVGGQPGCAAQSRPGINISALPGLRVAGQGEWALVMWRYDEAGNENGAVASDPVRLRLDSVPPAPAFEPPTLTDPTRVAVQANDRTSGLAGGEIELKRSGTVAWQSVPARRVGQRLVGRIDDSKLPAGTYELRSRAVDQAGNEATTRHRLDGSPATLSLPLRFASVLAGGIQQIRVVRRMVRRRGKRRRIRRKRTRIVPAATVAFGRRARITGQLANSDGQPIPSATVFVLSRPPGGTESLSGMVTTDSNGRYSYLVRATNTKSVRFAYLGTTLVLPSSREVNIVVPASSTLGVNRRRARNGGSVVFRGRVRSQPLPPTGKLVEMQAFFRRKWRTFSTVRSDAQGRWRFRYRFGGTVGRVRYRFRAQLPAEGGYPFATGRSPVVGVIVRGS